jgi:hypothetical protein
VGYAKFHRNYRDGANLIRCAYFAWGCFPDYTAADDNAMTAKTLTFWNGNFEAVRLPTQLMCFSGVRKEFPTMKGFYLESPSSDATCGRSADRPLRLE